MSNAFMRTMPIMLDVASESDLVARAQRGAAAEREAAFAELFRQFRGPVFALCLHLTGNVADAEDALQEVFLALHQGIGRFRGESRLFTWIYRIAIRIALRVKASRPQESREMKVDPVATTEDDPIVAREASERVFSALSHLSADHRVVITVRLPAHVTSTSEINGTRDCVRIRWILGTPNSPRSGSGQPAPELSFQIPRQRH